MSIPGTGWGDEEGAGESVVCGTALHAFTFDLPIITIGFTFNESVAKPIS